MAELEPPPDRVDPPPLAAERPMLEAWLDYHRATLLWKCQGLTDDQLRLRSVEPSSLSLLGLVRHLTEVERTWFRRTLAGEQVPPLYWGPDHPDGDFDGVDAADPTGDMAAYRAEVATCREVASRYELDSTGVRHGAPVSLRWILVHLVEEYARHNGHADLLRERIDGASGE